MKYIKQLTIILLISLAGESVKSILPFPIPASIYGMALMIILLVTKVLPLELIEDTADFLVSIMPVMFIPAAVGIISSWDRLKHVIIPVAALIVVTTVLVMYVSGRVTQTLMTKSKGKRNE